MPKADLIQNQDIAMKPEGCCSKPSEHVFPYWMNDYAYPYNNGCCPPPPPPYPPYPPFPPCPVNPPVASIEAQIAKLSKKSATIRKMIDGLVNKNKSILITIAGCSYNFGTYTVKDAETLVADETEYGKAVLTLLEDELAAIKEKIVELTEQLEVEDTNGGGTEGTVTL